MLTDGYRWTSSRQVNKKEFLMKYTEKKEIKPQNLRIFWSRGFVSQSVSVCVYGCVCVCVFDGGGFLFA